MSVQKSWSELQKMARSARIIIDTLDALEAAAVPGTTTADLDRIARESIENAGARPAFLNYRGFPATLCASVNEEVVHGSPGGRKLREGDIVGLDLGCILDGFFGDSARTVAVGSMVDPGTRTIPVLFEVENSDGAIKVGAHARVSLRTGEVEEGILIPDSAVLEEDGHAIAYVQAEGERFERRELALGPRAAARVLVRSGIEAGERVVTGAAYQVRLASLSTAVPAHGHAH